MHMKPICFIVPFFIESKYWFDPRPKQMPSYFEYFLHSFEQNGLADLHLFTNANVKSSWLRNFSSIKIHKLSFKSLKQRISEKLNIESSHITPYKLCDLKPTFGLIFDNYIKDYDFWGYCDIDMIIGNLKSVIPQEALDQADLITVSRSIVGYMTMYRNSQAISNLFRKSPDHEKVLNSPKHYRFDEIGNQKGLIAMRQILDGHPEINVARIDRLVHNDSGYMNKDRNWLYEWQTGRLMDVLADMEVGSLHFVKSKHKKDFSVPPLRRIRDFQGIQITPQGILCK